MEAANTLFEDRRVNHTRIDEYVALYSSTSLQSIDQPPRTILTILNELKSSNEDSTWSQLNLTAVHISILILACAHISNKDACGDFPISENITTVGQSSLYRAVAAWNGNMPIGSHATTAFKIMALVVLREPLPTAQEGIICLLSSRGWSMFLTTFGDADPSFTGNSPP